MSTVRRAAICVFGAIIPIVACTRGASDSDSVSQAGLTTGAASGWSALPRAEAYVCGNGVREAGEECDEGASAGPHTFCTSQCTVRDVLASLTALEAGDAAPGHPMRVLGPAHAAAATSQDVGVVFVETDGLSSSVMLAVDNALGVPDWPPMTLDSAALGDASPALATASTNLYVAAWTDYAADGDGRGVAVSVVNPAAGTPGPVRHANTTTTGDQQDPDVLGTASGAVIAFTDMSNPATAPDVRVRLYDTSLQPIGGDQALAATSDAESDVTLAAFGGSWAAAWRVGSAAGESIKVAAGSTSWSVGPYTAGAAADRPALVALDATHLLLAFDQTADPNVPGVFALRAAVLDVAHPGAVTSVAVPSVAASASQPVAVAANGQIFVAWHEDAVPGNPKGEEAWFQSVGWNGTALDFSASPLPLPRGAYDRLGDQRTPALAASGSSLVAAWNDLSGVLGSPEGQGDVALELVPLPLTRDLCTPGYVKLDPAAAGTNVTVGPDWLSVQDLSLTVRESIRATAPRSSGKWYWEVTILSLVSQQLTSSPMIGVGDVNAPLSGRYIGETGDGWGYYPFSGYRYNNACQCAGPPGIGYGPWSQTAFVGDVIGVELDIDNGTLAYTKNGVSIGTAFTNLPRSGVPLYPMVGGANSAYSTAVRFAPPFLYAPPPGFSGYGAYDATTFDRTATGAPVSLDVDDLTAYTYTGNRSSSRATCAKASGKWFWEVTIDALTDGEPSDPMIGVGDGNAPLTGNYVGGTGDGWSYFPVNALKYNNACGCSGPPGIGYGPYGQTATAGDVIGLALDVDDGTLTFFKNGVSMGTAFTNVLEGVPLYPMVGAAGTGPGYRFAARARFDVPFAYAMPTGYRPYALEDP